MSLSKSRTGTRGALAVATGAGVWGMFWIPLRYVDEQGFTGLWAVMLMLGAAIVPAVVAMLWRGKQAWLRSGNTWLIGIAMSISTVLYFSGMLFSDIIRVVFLFYLLPVWTTLASWLFYGDRIGARQLSVIALALFGLWLLLGGGQVMFPVPNNVGDWCGLLSGVGWGISLALLRGRDTGSATATVVVLCGAAFVWVSVAVLAIPMLVPSTEFALPDLSNWQTAIPMAVLFTSVMMVPSMQLQVWGARQIQSSTAALLTMTEIIVATLSAYILIGTELNSLSWLGALIIFSAVLIDVWLQRNQQTVKTPG